MARYDYRCGKCGRLTERIMPMNSNSKTTFPCQAKRCRGRCKRVFNPQFEINATPVSNLFPYVSSRLPFGLKGEPTTGKLQKVVVQNKQHKDRLYKKHGFVRE